MPNFTEGVRLAFDVGKVRVGVAASDRFGIISSPVVTLQREDKELDLKIQTLSAHYEPTEIFVGLPKNLRGNSTESTVDAVRFARKVFELVNVPVFLVDERFSTVSAAADLRASGRSAKNSKGIVDQQAACVILDTALGFLKMGKTAGVGLDKYEE